MEDYLLDGGLATPATHCNMHIQRDGQHSLEICGHTRPCIRKQFNSSVCITLDK